MKQCDYSTFRSVAYPVRGGIVLIFEIIILKKKEVIDMEMPKISMCDMTECFYNTKKVCHAPAINIGSDHPLCDTFMKGGMHGGAMDMTGSVGACKVDHCRHNTSFLCSAQSIKVGHHGSHADCKTYAPR